MSPERALRSGDATLCASGLGFLEFPGETGSRQLPAGPQRARGACSGGRRAADILRMLRGSLRAGGVGGLFGTSDRAHGNRYAAGSAHDLLDQLPVYPGVASLQQSEYLADSLLVQGMSA